MSAQVLVRFSGERRTLKEIAELLGIPYRVICKRWQRKRPLDAPYKPHYFD